MRTPAAVLVTALMTTASPSALGCRCSFERSLADDYAQARAVYAAEVLSVEPDGARANVRVLEVFKGNPRSTVVVHDRAYRTNCSIGFGGIGSRLVLFVDAQSSFGACSRITWLGRENENTPQQKELLRTLRDMRAATQR